MYVEGGSKSKFPSRDRVFKQEKSFTDRCVDSLKEAIANHELETDQPTPYVESMGEAQSSVRDIH